MFRFHTGSIKRVAVRHARARSDEFRFHTGSIKRMSGDYHKIVKAEVSIPYWFD